jgi:lipoate-protein ligase A
MALDHALAETLSPRAGVIRFYSWSAPTVSFGRNEPSRGRYDLEAAAREGIEFVRRPTGGRAVLHADEITYSVVAPVHALGGVRAAYARINQGLVAGLARLGVPAQVCTEGVTVGPHAGPCFRAPVPGEVVLRGRKLIGSAQARFGDQMLQHGSIILSGDQGALASLCGGDADSVSPAALARELAGMDRLTVIDGLSQGIVLALGGARSKGGYAPAELDVANRLERERYAADAWTWRR